MNRNVFIIGGGLSGLAASLYLARGGFAVTIFERRRFLGGRAITQLRQGYRFNLGPHAVFRGGAAMRVYHELGIPIRGGVVKGRGIALRGGERYRLPSGPFSMLATGLLTVRAKAEAAKLLVRIARLDPSRDHAMSVREWLDANVSDAVLRETMEALVRLATYSADTRQSAAFALAQLKVARRRVLYVDEGWQKIVDALHSAAVAAGVNFVTSSRIVRVDHDGGAVRGIEMGELELEDHADTMSIAMPDMHAYGGEGARIPADHVILAVDPATVRSLAGIEAGPFTPVNAACLDVALSRLPDPETTLAAGTDTPEYFAVHSRWAQLTPKGGALVHVARYGEGTEAELEALLDKLQPGWREVLVHRRYLPSMVVSNALVTPSMNRPTAATGVRGLYVAGDWVGDQGLLSDAALWSARAAAKAILATAS